jgi:hypothetical protein
MKKTSIVSGGTGFGGNNVEDKHIIDQINKEDSYFYKITRKASNWYGIIALIIQAILFYVYPGRKRIADLFFIIVKFLDISITKENMSMAATLITSIGCGIMFIAIYFIIKLLVYILLKIIIFVKKIE